LLLLLLLLIGKIGFTLGTNTFSVGDPGLVILEEVLVLSINELDNVKDVTDSVVVLDDTVIADLRDRLN
jgi:hypothetical protein